MNKSKLLGVVAASVFLSLVACKKNDNVEPKIPENSNPIIYGWNRFEMNIDGAKWYGKEKAYFYTAGYNYCLATPNEKQVTINVDLSSDSDTTRRGMLVSFTLDENVAIGTYFTALGNMKNLSATVKRRVGYSEERLLARNYITAQESFTVVIDSIYKQKSEILLFGKLEGVLTSNRGSGTTISITNGKFGYKLQ